jgi:hypothetical protein
MYFRSDILLAHLLQYAPETDDGVKCSDVERYCEKIKEKLSEQASKDTYVYFGLNKLEDDAGYYPEHFTLFMGKYYKNRSFDIKYFSSLILPKTHKLLMDAAKI